MVIADTSEDEPPSAIAFARALLFVRTHGIAGFALLLAMYAMGFFSKAQTLGCGV